jgi:hypothetical protein
MAVPSVFQSDTDGTATRERKSRAGGYLASGEYSAGLTPRASTNARRMASVAG